MLKCQRDVEKQLTIFHLMCSSFLGTEIAFTSKGKVFWGYIQMLIKRSHFSYCSGSHPDP